MSNPFPLAFTVALSACLPVLAENVLPTENAGFEEGLKGWTIQAANPAVARCLPEAASFGTNGLRVGSTPDCLKYEITSTSIPVKAGETYLVSFWSGKGGERTGKNVQVEMLFKGADGTVLKPAAAAIRRWPAVEARGGVFFDNPTLGAAAPEGAATLAIRVRNQGSGASGPVDLDDFKIIEYQKPEAAAAADPKAGHPIPPSDPERIKLLLAEIKRDPFRGKSPPRIVLKLDDLKPHHGSIHPRWKKIADFAEARKIKASFGIIAKPMEEECPVFCEWVKRKHAEGSIEFWNHGYDHAGDNVLREFSGQPYEHQKEHMSRANQLAREKLGFSFVSFGAPFNATDASTVKVLSEDPDIKVWMYGDARNTTGKVVLERAFQVSVENPTLIPNYAAFLEGYAHNRGSEYFVLQGHPAGWGDDRYEQFTMIVDFLISQNAVFVLPREFAR